MIETFKIKLFYTNVSDAINVVEAAFDTEFTAIKVDNGVPISISQLRIGTKVRNTIVYRKQILS